jgi:hypothetical protein
MPIYTYRCRRGHQFDAIVKLDGSDAPTQCLNAPTVHGLDHQGIRQMARCPRCGSYVREDHQHYPNVTHVEGCPGICAEPVEKTIALNAQLFPGADSWRK